MAVSEIVDTNTTFVRPKRQKKLIPARIMRSMCYCSWLPKLQGSFGPFVPKVAEKNECCRDLSALGPKKSKMESKKSQNS